MLQYHVRLLRFYIVIFFFSLITYKHQPYLLYEWSKDIYWPLKVVMSAADYDTSPTVSTMGK